MPALASRDVEGEDTVAQRGDEQVARCRRQYAGGRCADGLADGFMTSGFAVAVEIDAQLRPYPYAAVGILMEGVYVGTVGSDGDMLQLLR